MRVLVAGLFGGVVFFVWGAISHMMLGLGDKGFHYGTPYHATLSALKQEAPEAGVYMLPSVPEAKMQDEAAIKALLSESAGQGWAFVVYAPGGNPGNANMLPNLGKQFATDLFSALLAAWLLSAVNGFGKRVAMAATMGLFAWATVQLPYWNWYLFPLSWTMGLLLKFVIGWFLAGAAMAWWLGRGRSHRSLMRPL